MFTYILISSSRDVNRQEVADNELKNQPKKPRILKHMQNSSSRGKNIADDVVTCGNRHLHQNSCPLGAVRCQAISNQEAAAGTIKHHD